jgi:hypothetical protein
MPAHSFLFHPEAGEFHNYIEAIEKVESRQEFQGRVAVDVQRHGGNWVGEFSAATSRMLMAFITEFYMELPPAQAVSFTDVVETAEEGEDEPYTENHASNFPEQPTGTDGSESSEEPSSEDEEWPETPDGEEEEEDILPEVPDGPVGENSAPRIPRKLKKPVSKNTPAVTVEED